MESINLHSNTNIEHFYFWVLVFTQQICFAYIVAKTEGIAVLVMLLLLLPQCSTKKE